MTKEIAMNVVREDYDPILSGHQGDLLGISDWVKIDQAMIDGFGELTRDIDPLHMDTEWATKFGPFGGTTAYGFLTISMLTHLFRSMAEQDLRSVDFGLFLNYGFDKMRLVSPVPSGSRIRGRFQHGGIREDDGGRRIIKILCEVEVEGQERPALVCEWLSAWLPPESCGGKSLSA
jgi:acyl dehydratase